MLEHGDVSKQQHSTRCADEKDGKRYSMTLGLDLVVCCALKIAIRSCHERGVLEIGETEKESDNTACWVNLEVGKKLVMLCF